MTLLINEYSDFAFGPFVGKVLSRCPDSSGVERHLGKMEVPGSNPGRGSDKNSLRVSQAIFIQSRRSDVAV